MLSNQLNNALRLAGPTVEQQVLFFSTKPTFENKNSSCG
jgi:hypothetical protein